MPSYVTAFRRISLRCFAGLIRFDGLQYLVNGRVAVEFKDPGRFFSAFPLLRSLGMTRRNRRHHSRHGLLCSDGLGFVQPVHQVGGVWFNRQCLHRGLNGSARAGVSPTGATGAATAASAAVALTGFAFTALGFAGYGCVYLAFVFNRFLHGRNRLTGWRGSGGYKTATRRQRG